MCNLYTQTKSVDEVARIFRDLQMPIVFPEGLPNLAPRDIAITDPGVIVRRAQTDAGSYDLLVRRWSWPGAGGKPVYNFRSDGREFPSGRCLIVADGFYEFTASSEPKQKRKDRWLFTPSAGGLLGIAGITRNSPEVGEAFTLLTGEPGPDVAPFHRRQIVLLDPADWRRWLDPAVPSAELLKPSLAGYLAVERA